MLIWILDAEFLMQQLKVTPLPLRKLVACVTQHLHLRTEALDEKSRDRARACKIMSLEDEALCLPRRDSSAMIIEAHRMHVNFSPICILKHEGCRCLVSTVVENPTAFGPKLLQAVSTVAQEPTHHSDVVHERDHVEVLVRSALLKDQGINPPSAGKPKSNSTGRKPLVDADRIFSANHSVPVTQSLAVRPPYDLEMPGPEPKWKGSWVLCQCEWSGSPRHGVCGKSATRFSMNVTKRSSTDLYGSRSGCRIVTSMPTTEDDLVTPASTSPSSAQAVPSGSGESTAGITSSSSASPSRCIQKPLRGEAPIRGKAACAASSPRSALVSPS
jgi:hypothetical protein